MIRWALIAGRIPGRTDNEIKNYWNSHLSKKLISQGIDPRTHKPLNLNPASSEQEHDHHLASSSNPNPNPPPLQTEETPYISSQQATNFPTNPHKNHEPIINNDISMDGFIINHEDYFGHCNEDTFSSFLDSLINDNVFVNQQHQLPQLPTPPHPHVVVSSTHHPVVSSSSAHNSFNYSNWEADQIVSTMVALGDNHEQTAAAFNNHRTI